VDMIHGYKSEFRLAAGKPASTLQILTELGVRSKGAQYIVPFAADVLGVELPETKPEFDRLMEECREQASTRVLEPRAVKALAICWQLRLLSKGWSDDVGESLEGDIKLVINMLVDTYKPWNE